MECAAKGLVAEPCAGDAHRRCGSCGAVAYCSRAHQFVHWRVHKEECARLATQMSHIDMLSQFPFTFSMDPLPVNHAFPSTRCFFLESIKVHLKGLWKSECICGPEVASVKDLSITAEWNMESSLCPCAEPENPVPAPLTSWEDYYQWRSLPLHSPVAVLLHWPSSILTSEAKTRDIAPMSNSVKKQVTYGRRKCKQDASLDSQHRQKKRATRSTYYISLPSTILQTSGYDGQDTLRIHYLGPEKELLQLAVFAELCALFPGVQLCIELVGPAVPKSRDGEVVNISSYANCSDEICHCRSSIGSKDLNGGAMVLKLWNGFYHERFSDIVKDSSPHLILAPNAGVAAYPSWMPTIEMIREIGIPAIFTDFCEEAAHLASCCIRSITGQPLTVPVQVNPFRQPIAENNNALYIPCYSNCFVFGM